MAGAQRVANVTSIQQTANELNTAMGQLQHGIDDLKSEQNKLKNIVTLNKVRKLLMIKL